MSLRPHKRLSRKRPASSSDGLAASREELRDPNGLIPPVRCMTSREADNIMLLKALALPSAVLQLQSSSVQREAKPPLRNVYVGPREKRLRPKPQLERGTVPACDESNTAESLAMSPNHTGSHSADDATPASGRRSISTPPTISPSCQFATDEEVRGKWITQRSLAKNHFSEVLVCANSETGELRAVKVINKRGMLHYHKNRGSRALSLASEAELLGSLFHDGVVKMHEWYETKNHVYLVMEFVAGGDLLRLLMNEECLKEAEARRLFQELCEAVHYLHSQGIVHRDLKLENILLTADADTGDKHLKVSDFGISRKVLRSRDSRTFCGSLAYTAPEVVKMRPHLEPATPHTQRQVLVVGGRPVSTDEPGGTEELLSGYGKPADMWSLGVILYMMLSGYPPFNSDEDPESLCANIVNGTWQFDGDFNWQSVSIEARDLVLKLLEPNPQERLTAQDALDHAWFK